MCKLGWFMCLIDTTASPPREGEPSGTLGVVPPCRQKHRVEEFHKLWYLDTSTVDHWVSNDSSGTKQPLIPYTRLQLTRVGHSIRTRSVGSLRFTHKATCWSVDLILYARIDVIFYHSARQWGTADAEIKVLCAENPEPPKVLALKPGVGQKIAFHDSSTARNSIFFISAYVVLHFPVSSVRH